MNAAEFNYTVYSFTLTATGASTVLQFSGRENPAWYLLDNVSVTGARRSYPEPSSLTLLGIGALGSRATPCVAGRRGTPEALMRAD